MSTPSARQRVRRFSSWSTHLCNALLLASALYSGLALALPTDRDQPIRITADTAIRDEKQGFTIYSGNVHMIQGSMDIVADKVTIFHEAAQADKIVAEGKPAKMQQRPAIGEPMVQAQAEIIEYFKTEDRVHLRVNANIVQDGASVAGDTIDYYIADQLVKADSNQAVNGNRVQVVIPPTVVREEGADDGSADSN